MNISLLTGLGLIIIAAVCNGLYAAPSKYMKSLNWENTWGSFFLMTTIIIPLIVAMLFLNKPLNSLIDTWTEAGSQYIIIPFVFGMLWGLGFILWGKGLALTGISLGYTIAFGLVAIVGSVIPLLLASGGNDFSKGNMVILTGILICLAGIIVSGIAGKNRESLQNVTKGGVNRKLFLKGLLFVVLAGLFSGCLNIGFTYGAVIVERSISIYNNKPWMATLNIWLLLFAGCFIVSGSYTLILHIKNRSFRNYISNNSGKDMMKILLMAVLHFLNLFLYGAGAYLLGKSGNVVGWAINFSLALVVANIFGILSGEWKGIHLGTKVSLYGGVLLLVIGSVILGIGNNI